MSIHFILIPLGYSLVISFIVLLCFAWAYRNPYKLIMVFGKKGSGKTTLIAKLTYMYLKKGIPVYSTVPIPGAYLFDVKEIGFSMFPEDCVIFIDEVGMIWDNRNFKNFMTEVRDYFKLQRHYKHTVYLFSQSFDVDIKLRNLTDSMYLVRTYFNVVSIARRVNRNITIVHPSGEGESRIADDLDFAPLLALWSRPIRITWIPTWVKYFDSFEVPELKPAQVVKCEFPIDFEERTFKYKAVNWIHGKYQNCIDRMALCYIRFRSRYLPFLPEPEASPVDIEEDDFSIVDLDDYDDTDDA